MDNRKTRAKTKRAALPEQKVRELLRLFREGQVDEAWNGGLSEFITRMANSLARVFRVVGYSEEDLAQELIARSMSLLRDVKLDYSIGTLEGVMYKALRYHCLTLITLSQTHKRTVETSILSLNKQVKQTEFEVSDLLAGKYDAKKEQWRADMREVIAEFAKELTPLELCGLSYIMGGRAMEEVAKDSGYTAKQIDNCRSRLMRKAAKFFADYRFD